MLVYYQFLDDIFLKDGMSCRMRCRMNEFNVVIPVETH